MDAAEGILGEGGRFDWMESPLSVTIFGLLNCSSKNNKV